MKNFLLFLFTGLCMQAFAQPDTMYVNGRFLYNHAGEKVILKGINYSVLDDWGFPGNITSGGESLQEIEKTKANCVRIQWYNNYGQPSRPAYALKDLDTLLTRSATFKMIPVVGLWDKTCDNDYTAFASAITAWWTQTAVVNLFKKHRRYSIINLANEFGYYNYAGGTATALNAYKNGYKTAITSLRTAGYTQPIMIDAPDCGTNADAQILTGAEILAHDPLHNIIFSTHAYWIAFTGNDSTVMANKVQQMVNSNLPFVFGEIANYQSDNTPCQYSLNYTALLKTLKQKETGWLAWNWTFDYCADRQMTPDGLFINMGPYGQDITNNPVYGLAANAVRSDATFNNFSVVAANKLILSADCSHHTLSADYDADVAAVLTILQSTDGQNWQPVFQKNISSIAGQVNTVVQKPAVTTYYKAITVNASGSTLQSNTVVCRNPNSLPVIYPNPAKDYFTIEGNSAFTAVEIIDLNGRLLLRKNIFSNIRNRIDIRSLPNGLYGIKYINAGNSYVLTGKLTVLR